MYGKPVAKWGERAYNGSGLGFNRKELPMFGGGFGWSELLIILVIVLVVFGGGKIAGVGGSLGTAIREFKDAVTKKDEDPKPVDPEPEQ
jgi:sec-independent protein translocase protein TatA